MPWERNKTHYTFYTVLTQRQQNETAATVLSLVKVWRRGGRGSQRRGMQGGDNAGTQFPTSPVSKLLHKPIRSGPETFFFLFSILFCFLLFSLFFVPMLANRNGREAQHPASPARIFCFCFLWEDVFERFLVNKARRSSLAFRNNAATWIH